MARKIVQIAAIQESLFTRGFILALADDGSAWFCPLSGNPKDEWHPLPPLPQEATDEP